MNRDPIEEKGGVNVYGFVRNNPSGGYDYLGMKCKSIILFGHGSAMDTDENWLLHEAIRWSSKLDGDGCDSLSLFGCNTYQVVELLIKKLSTDLTDDERYKIMLKLAFLINGSLWPDKVSRYNYQDRWNYMQTSLKQSLELMCDKGCCCSDILITIHCQNDESILRTADTIADNLRKNKNSWFADVPTGENFCGKTWRWSCAGKYLIYEQNPSSFE